jgi:type IV secretory pathway TrbL component
MGEALAGVLLTCVKTGVFYFLLLHLTTIATAAYQTFLQWGAAPSGGEFSHASFFEPASVVDLGFAVAGDVYDMGNRLSLWTKLNHPFMLSLYGLAWWLVVIAFAFVALHLMMTIIEYHLALLVGTVLIPWGILQPTAFFSEFSIGWLTGGLVRVLVTGGIVGVGRPLFRTLNVTLVGGDPTPYSATVVALSAGIFALLTWVVPGRAASIAGRGVSLALQAGTLLAGAASPLRGMLLVRGAVRGVSRLVEAMRR